MTKRKVVTLGHAVGDERGKSSGGKAGNQNGQELRLQEWYKRAKGWPHVLRAKKKAVAKKIGQAMKACVANKHIGYDQGQRTTLYREALNAKWDIAKIKTDCETDCSALVSVCLNVAGITISKDIYTGNMVEKIMETGSFNDLTAAAYTQSPDELAVGDILVGPGHTAVVVEVTEQLVLDRELRYISGALKTGDDVKVLQKRIKELGYKIKVDGIFGINTEAAVMAVQKRFGLKADGIVGKKTAEALGFTWAKK